MALKIIEDTDTSLTLRFTNTMLSLAALIALLCALAAFGLLGERATLMCDRNTGGACVLSRFSIRGVQTTTFNLHELTGVDIVAYTNGRGAKYRIEFLTAGAAIPLTTHTSTFKYFEQRMLDQIRATLADRSQARIQIDYGPQAPAILLSVVLGLLSLAFVHINATAFILLSVPQNTLTLKTRQWLRSEQERTLPLDQVVDIRSIEVPPIPFKEDRPKVRLFVGMEDGREIALFDEAVDVGAHDRLAIKQQVNDFLARRPSTQTSSK